ncbi:Proteasome inhibitor [Actinidia chinensis var. chinensis]|uniref:Proteasome inhibitor n=1 Tax=Actinidia chinensis var. chinensis TaxID=1590841 RepID=A0A2R6PFU9_ACTCC|nr:Proteasome inhibitor [Actinidia chinensis var. chinensis]
MLQLVWNWKIYVTENDTDYGSKYNNFNKLVSIIDRAILSKLNGTSKESSSTLPSSSTTRDWEVTEPQRPQPYPPSLFRSLGFGSMCLEHL